MVTHPVMLHDNPLMDILDRFHARHEFALDSTREVQLAIPELGEAGWTHELTGLTIGNVVDLRELVIRVTDQLNGTIQIETALLTDDTRFNETIKSDLGDVDVNWKALYEKEHDKVESLQDEVNDLAERVESLTAEPSGD